MNEEPLPKGVSEVFLFFIFISEVYPESPVERCFFSLSAIPTLIRIKFSTILLLSKRTKKNKKRNLI